jgi:hypothetical protein
MLDTKLEKDIPLEYLTHLVSLVHQVQVNILGELLLPFF